MEEAAGSKISAVLLYRKAFLLVDYRCITVPEWEKEQEYLRQQHKNGWKFVKVDLIGRYQFEKCEPEDVVYQLDYNPDGYDETGIQGTDYPSCFVFGFRNSLLEILEKLSLTTILVNDIVMTRIIVKMTMIQVK